MSTPSKVLPGVSLLLLPMVADVSALTPNASVPLFVNYAIGTIPFSANAMGPLRDRRQYAQLQAAACVAAS